MEFPAKASGNDCYNAFPSHNDWYDTVKLNYGVDPANGSHHFDPIPPTWHKMLHILRYWPSKGIDGFRCDMVHMVPLEFWQWAISNLKAEFPRVIFIAELYDIKLLYRPFVTVGGFDYLYDKTGIYDTLPRHTDRISFGSRPHILLAADRRPRTPYAQLPRKSRRAAFCIAAICRRSCQK